MSRLRAAVCLFSGIVDEFKPPLSVKDAAFTYFTAWLFHCVDITSFPQRISEEDGDDALVDALTDYAKLSEFVLPLAKSEGLPGDEVLEFVKDYVNLFVSKAKRTTPI